MSILEFQTHYLNAIETNDANLNFNLNGGIDYDYYETKLKTNSALYINELCSNLFGHKYKTFISILYLEFNELYNTVYALELTKYWAQQKMINNTDYFIECYSKIMEETKQFIEFYYLNELNSQILIDGVVTQYLTSESLENTMIKMSQKKLYGDIEKFVLLPEVNIRTSLLQFIANSIFNIPNFNYKNLIDLIKCEKLVKLNTIKLKIMSYVNNDENLDLIFNQLVRKENPTLNNCLPYINNTDIFLTKYKTYISEFNIESDFNINYHSDLVERCNKCNFIDIHHIKKMITEYTNVVSYNSGVPIDMRLGTYGIWPYTPCKNIVSKSFSSIRSLIEAEFDAANKKLYWKFDDITATINFGNYVLITPLKLVDILLKFNDTDSIESISKNNIYERFLLKVGILKLRDTSLEVNENFSYKTKTINLKTKFNKLIKKNVEKRNNTNNINTNNINTNEIGYLIECSIMTLMKKYKALEHNELLVKLKELIKVKITKDIFDSAIKSLIKKEYLDNQSTKFIYIP